MLRVSRVFQRVILIVLIILEGCATAPLRSGQDVRSITLLATGDFHGLMEPSDSASGLSEGGIARIASLIKEIRAESEHPVLAISTGDSLMGRYFHVFRGRAIFRLMTAAGYDLCALGNHEFDKGRS
ncbi:MAG: metallophosphoesterase, partial [Desulfobacterales bacterium]|nr:metallophosphoesterase [Desulfobacterales bacterium]